MALEDLDEEAIARMLEEADKEEVNEVDATGVKQLLLLLERKINRNQMMRVKFPEQPARFVDSEVSTRTASTGPVFVRTLQGLPEASPSDVMRIESNIVRDFHYYIGQERFLTFFVILANLKAPFL